MIDLHPSAPTPAAVGGTPVDVSPELRRAGLRTALAEEWLFLRSWFGAPLRTGAQRPSGRALARAMARWVDPCAPGLVLELGPGTGPVTRALLERGIAPERLLLIEANPQFCDLLRLRHPDCRLLQGDALAVPRALRRQQPPPVSAVVSSLPLMAMAPRVRLRLLHDCLRLMGPQGRFIQFTYASRSPVPLRGARVSASVSPRIWRNLWPAKVWCYREVSDDDAVSEPGLPDGGG